MLPGAYQINANSWKPSAIEVDTQKIRYLKGITSYKERSANPCLRKPIPGFASGYLARLPKMDLAVSRQIHFGLFGVTLRSSIRAEMDPAVSRGIHLRPSCVTKQMPVASKWIWQFPAKSILSYSG